MGSRYVRAALASAFSAAAIAAFGAGTAAAASDVTYFPSQFGSSITITGEANDDLVSVAVDGNTVTITDTGTNGIATADADCANAGGAVTCPLDPPDPALPASPTGPVLNVSASLGDGADSFAGSRRSSSASTGAAAMTWSPEGPGRTTSTAPRARTRSSAATATTG